MSDKRPITARWATCPDDLGRALALRQVCFRAGRDGRADSDAHDATSRHVLIERAGDLLACFRVMIFANGRDIGGSYAAQTYDLERLSAFPAPMLELGRFCIHPAASLEPDVLRIAWGALAGLVERDGIGLMFGCSSFAGADPAPHAAGLTLLARHIGPDKWRPGAKAAETCRLAGLGPEGRMTDLPPLLRTYISMGGWVSDHAVLDRDLDTLHVFTAVEVAKVPPARARALRALSVALASDP